MSSLTIPDLKSILRKRQVPIPKNAKKATLLSLLKESEEIPENATLKDISTLSIENLRKHLSSKEIKIPSRLFHDDLKLREWAIGALREKAFGFNLNSACVIYPILYDKIDKIWMPPTVDVEMYIRGRDLTLSETEDLPKQGTIEVDWLEHLLGFGWAVVPNAIVKRKVNSLQGEFWKWIESFRNEIDLETPTFLRNDSTTWKKEYLATTTVQGNFKTKINHQAFLWEARRLVKQYWEEIYNTEDLAVSFEGGRFQPPVEEENKGLVTPRLHSHQFRWDDRRISIQGVLYLTDSHEEDGGFCFLQPSNLTVKEFFNLYMQRHPSNGICSSVANHEDPLLQSIPLQKVCANRGDLLLFDSRLMHATIPSQRNYEMTLSISYQPRTNISPETNKDRREAFEKGIGTSHWVGGPWYEKQSPLSTLGNTVYIPTIEKKVSFKKVKDLI